MRRVVVAHLCCSALAISAQSLSVPTKVAIQVELDKPQGAYKPIGNWFGYDESN